MRRLSHGKNRLKRLTIKHRGGDLPSQLSVAGQRSIELRVQRMSQGRTCRGDACGSVLGAGRLRLPGLIAAYDSSENLLSPAYVPAAIWQSLALPPTLAFASLTADCWFLTGPTASGKTAVGLELARAAERRNHLARFDGRLSRHGHRHGQAHGRRAAPRVPHHLIDLVEPDEEFSVAQYVGRAEHAVRRDSRARHASAVRGRHAAVSQVAAARDLRRPAGRLGVSPASWKQMASAKWPAEPCTSACGRSIRSAAARLHPHDTRRLIRALEVYQETGQPISDLQTQFDAGRAGRATAGCSCSTGRAKSCTTGSTPASTRCSPPAWSTKCSDCWRTARPLSRTAAQAVGYREVIEHLRGERDFAGDDRTGQNSHPAVRQAASDLVPQPERMPLGAGLRAARSGGSGAANLAHQPKRTGWRERI